MDLETRGWDVGRAYRYRVQLTTVLAFAGAKAFDFDLVGVLQLVRRSTAGPAVQLLARLADIHVATRLSPGTREFDKLTRELTTAECLLTYAGGLLAGLDLPRGISAMAANTFRQIGASLQFARSKGGATWYSAEEYDTTGAYVAAYSSDGLTGEWNKHKERYLALLSDEQPRVGIAPDLDRVVPQVVASSGRVRLAESGRPLRVTTHDELAIRGAQAPVDSSTDVSLDATSDEPTKWPSELESTLTAMRHVTAGAQYASVPVDALDDARIGGLSFSQILGRLEQLAREEGGDTIRGPINGRPLPPDVEAEGKRQVEKRSQLFIALAALFRRQPDTIRLATQAVHDGSPASSVLIEALGSASTPESQRALAVFVEGNARDPQRRDRALLALARGSRPSEASIRTLERVLEAEPFSMQALYGLGTACRHLRDAGDTERMTAIGEFLTTQLGSAAADPSRITVLNAIANSGYVPALRAVMTYVSDRSEHVRVAAVRALQSMGDPSVDGILVNAMENDGANAVRIAAIEAAEVRLPSDTLANGLATAATTAADPHVRYRAVDLMSRWISRRQDLRPALQQVAQTDAEEQIRSRARAAL